MANLRKDSKLTTPTTLSSTPTLFGGATPKSSVTKAKAPPTSFFNNSSPLPYSTNNLKQAETLLKLVLKDPSSDTGLTKDKGFLAQIHSENLVTIATLIAYINRANETTAHSQTMRAITDQLAKFIATVTIQTLSKSQTHADGVLLAITHQLIAYCLSAIQPYPSPSNAAAEACNALKTSANQQLYGKHMEPLMTRIGEAIQAVVLTPTTSTTPSMSTTYS